ncbi:MAG: DMT family transporter [Candidatus Hydrothermales bacterium]
MDEGLVLSVLATFLWSTVATAFKLTLRYLTFREMLFYSSLTSFLILFLIHLFTSRKRKKSLFRISKGEILSSVILGFLNPYLYYLILFKAYSLLRAQIAQPLNYTWPILLTFISSFFLKTKVSFKNILALFISFLGVIVIATQGEFKTIKVESELGVFLALFSSLIFALYWVLNLKDKRSEVEKLTMNFFFGFLYIFLTQIFTDSIRIPSLKGLIGSIYIGLFEMGITYLIWLYALKKSKNIALVSNLIYLSPFISLFLISLILKEKIMSSSIIGLIVIISGILLNRL